MTWSTQLVLCATAGLFAVPLPPEKPVAGPVKAKIEFRWLEGKAVKGLTQDQGIQTTCGDERSYPHLVPVLTNTDLAGATMTHHDFSANGLSNNLYMIQFRLTDAARKKLVEACGEAPGKELAVFVDGRYWGTSNFRKADAARFSPHAGFISSLAEAERIVDAVK